MPRLIKNQLTVRQVETLGPGVYADGGGLYLVVGPSSRSWILRYQIQGRRRDMGLGSTRYVSLRDARELAYEAQRQIVLQKTDPLEQRRNEQSAKAAAQTIKQITFEQCAKEYARTKQQGDAAWTYEHGRNWEAAMGTYVYPIIGKVPVANITIQHIRGVLEPIWITKPKLAKDTRSRLGAVIAYASASDWFHKENPARLSALTDLLPNQPKAKNHAALHHDDVTQFMLELRAVEKPVHLLLEFIVLTAVRRDEAREAEWSEFDFNKKIWTIPANRMKESEAHTVPLSTAALTVLEKMKAIRQNKFVFPGAVNPQISMTTLGEALKALRPDITLHGFRATFRTWFGSCTSWPRELAEHCLAHAVGSAVERAYNREAMVERRRPVMEAWAAHCAGDSEISNVVPLTRPA